jgi:NADPH:quinone reductase-like Zn-dependent oxidoreductase
MPKIVRFHQVGDASVLKLEELPKPQPGEGEALLKVEAIGLNRAEVMFRSGAYIDQPDFPSLIGYEASGIIQKPLSSKRSSKRTVTSSPTSRSERSSSRCKRF